MHGEGFIPWRCPRLRMPRPAGSRLKRIRSPPRQRVEESLDRGGEDTPTDDETLERRTKQRHDPRYAGRTTKEKAPGRTPPRRKRRVVELSSAEDEEKEHSSRGEDFDLQHDVRYVHSPSPSNLGRLCRCGRRLGRHPDAETDVCWNMQPFASSPRPLRTYICLNPKPGVVTIFGIHPIFADPKPSHIVHEP